jgi:uncharacterized protein (DUF1800 family)
MPASVPRGNRGSTGDAPALGRRVLAAGLVGAAVGLTPARGARAASPSISAATVAGLQQADRHLLRRFSYGANAAITADVLTAGGSSAWFEKQLVPEVIVDSAATALDGWFPSLTLTPQQMWSQYLNGRTLSSSISSEEFVRWTLLRRIRTNRQVHEVMTEFWSNLLHIASPDDSSWTHRPSYDKLLRRHALGRFDEMLVAAVTHPAMLLYLDNYASTKKAPNENLGREVLECHTVGRQTPYSETDVLNSTRILTGWAVDRGRTWQPSYDSAGHYVGPVKVMDFQATNASPDGRQTTVDYLTYLARHPATAARIARRLATRFVSDNPPQALVDDVAAVFRSSGTDIKTTLRALVGHPLFLTSAAPKIRTPTEDFVATCRALRMTISAPVVPGDFAKDCIWQASNIGPRPFDWPTPDGFPDSGASWSSATRMLGSWTVHMRLSAKGATGASFVANQTWLPTLPATAQTVVSTACARLLFEPPSAALVAAACESAGVRPDELITAQHKLVLERMPLLLACLLDSPTHMTR